MTRRITDTTALWKTLSPDVQAQIGAAAIAAELSIQGSTTPPPRHPSSVPEQQRWVAETDRYDDAGQIAQGILQDLLAENVADAYADDGTPYHIDLNPLGIRQCTICGCTQDHACDPPCAWAGPTLCTACVPTPPPEAPDAAA